MSSLDFHFVSLEQRVANESAYNTNNLLFAVRYLPNTACCKSAKVAEFFARGSVSFYFLHSIVLDALRKCQQLFRGCQRAIP